MLYGQERTTCIYVVELVPNPFGFVNKIGLIQLLIIILKKCFHAEREYFITISNTGNKIPWLEEWLKFTICCK